MHDERPDMVMLAGIITFLTVSGSVVFVLFLAFIGPEKMAEAWNVNQESGLNASRKGVWAVAEKHFRDALHCAERANSVEKMAESQFAIGVTLQRQNDFEGARHFLEKSLASYASLDDGRGPLIAGGDPVATKQTRCMIALAQMELKEAKLESASRWIESALKVRQKRLVPIKLGFQLRALQAEVLRRRGDSTRAMEIERLLPAGTTVDSLL